MTKKKKGFTLIELVIVMAIMGILMVAILSLTDPVQRMHRKTSTNENTYAMADNIQKTIQRTLEYADYVWITTDGSKLDEKMLEFKNSYYNNIVVAKSESNVETANIKIYAMKLDNSDGKIYLDSADYKSDDAIAHSISLTTNILNDNYFEGANAKYTIRYSMNPAELKVTDTPAGSHTEKGDPYYTLNFDTDYKDYSSVSESATDQSISIIVSSGYDASTEVFTGPANITVANTPFTNIAARTNVLNNGTSKKADGMFRRIIKNTTTGKYEVQANADYNIPSGLPAAYSGDMDVIRPMYNFAAGTTPTTTTDIYYIFAYADEIK